MIITSISEIQTFLLKKLSIPEKELKIQEQKMEFLNLKINKLRELLYELDLIDNIYAKDIFYEIHKLELELKTTQEKIFHLNKEILRLLSLYQVEEIKIKNNDTIIYIQEVIRNE